MSLKNRRYPAYPLITCDPNFSVWSMSDTLNGDFTRHWTGSTQPLSGTVTVDGITKIFMGKWKCNPGINNAGPRCIEQKNVTVTPLKTAYTFADEKISLEVTFATPLLLDDLMLMSRPVSYISYSIKSLDGKDHECKIYFDASALLTVNKPDEEVYFHKTDISVFAYSGTDNMLKVSGDDLRINWGYLHLASRGGKRGTASDRTKRLDYIQHPYEKTELFGKRLPAGDNKTAPYPVLCYENEYTVTTEAVHDFICLGYDDIHSLEYFGKKIDAYYKKDGNRFYYALKEALDNYESIMERIDNFDESLLSEARKISEDYAALVSIAYRQAIAAHKLAYDGEKGVFVSKECFSNGCAATVDVTYPSVPLFLIYNPDLVEYMLNPIFDYAAGDVWRYEFAPHDAGRYPLVNGQVYGEAAGECMYHMQMPIEECGNMILCVAALCKARKNNDYAKKHYAVLKQWADYLVKFGLDPENQLCTDDFAGHLAHNCNLSVKAIMGIAAWGMILNDMGEKNDYISKAEEMAAKWKKNAKTQNHYRLAFDKEDSWSIKYNLVWDKLFNLGIFDKDIFEDEVKYYKKNICKYGIPLDCRSDYTKSDWQMWSTVLTDDNEYRDRIVSAMLAMLCDTNDRVPFTDWYYSSTANQRGFQNRSVQGGLFINMLKFE